MGIFKQQDFRCGGCGQTKAAKVTVSPEQAQQPMAPPEGWGNVELVLQHQLSGALIVCNVFVCKEACGQMLMTGKGHGSELLKQIGAVATGKPVAGFGPAGSDFEAPLVTL